jgi:hypothetical protein
MVRSASLILVASLFAVTASNAADGWKATGDKRGKCQAQVPASWKPGEFGLGMVSPNDKSDVAISSSPIGLAEAKAVAASTFTVDTVIEDSAARYWITMADRVGKPLKHQYIAVPAKGYVCVLSVDYDASVSEADVKIIMTSLRPKQ